MNVHHEAAEGFGQAAAAYERGRPTYPKEAVDWMVEGLGITASSTVIDLGAGTGKFTRMLLPVGARIIAVEPVAAMRNELARSVPGVDILDGSAEAIPCKDGSADAVTAAQAFHWFVAAGPPASVSSRTSRRWTLPGCSIGCCRRVSSRRLLTRSGRLSSKKLERSRPVGNGSSFPT